MQQRNKQLIDILQKHILSVLWLGAPAWYCLLTQDQKTDIDKVGKVGMEIMLGQRYRGFENSLQLTGISISAVSLAEFQNVGSMVGTAPIYIT